ncbi:MAG: hypothetical protein J7L71_01710 [Spirochaetaceae bacterium]|nr:hypothetical protein [Spirochaetaceae bacterium]
MKRLFVLLLLFMSFSISRYGKAEDFSGIVKNAKEIFTVDLKNFFNWSYDDKEEEIGWIGASPDVDLQEIPKGNVKFYEVPFYISSPDKKCVISVGYSYEIPLLNLPMKIGPVPVCKFADYLFFLHSSGWVRVGKGGIVGVYKVIYEDGKKEEIKVRRGYEVEDWYFTSKEKKLENGKVAWTKKFKNREVGICMSMWKNPYPGKKIKEIEIEGNKNAQFFVFAITGVKK